MYSGDSPDGTSAFEDSTYSTEEAIKVAAQVVESMRPSPTDSPLVRDLMHKHCWPQISKGLRCLLSKIP